MGFKKFWKTMFAEINSLKRFLSVFIEINNFYGGDLVV